MVGPAAQISRTNERLQQTHIFKVSSYQLKDLFDPLKKAARDRFETLKEQFDGVNGIIRSLMTDKNLGIVGDERDLYRRETFFGENKRPTAEIDGPLTNLW